MTKKTATKEATAVIRKLTLAKLTRDPKLQMRTRLSMDWVESLKDTLEAGGKLEPLDVFVVGEEFLIADGFHRDRAMMDHGTSQCNCLCRPESTWRDAFDFALGANAETTRALGLTRADKRRKVLLAIEHGRKNPSSRTIATLTGVSHTLVDNIKNELAEASGKVATDETRVASNGRVYTKKAKKRPARLNVVVEEREPVAPTRVIIAEAEPAVVKGWTVTSATRIIEEWTIQCETAIAGMAGMDGAKVAESGKVRAALVVLRDKLSDMDKAACNLMLDGMTTDDAADAGAKKKATKTVKNLA